MMGGRIGSDRIFSWPPIHATPGPQVVSRLLEAAERRLSQPRAFRPPNPKSPPRPARASVAVNPRVKVLDPSSRLARPCRFAAFPGTVRRSPTVR